VALAEEASAGAADSAAGVSAAGAADSAEEELREVGDEMNAEKFLTSEEQERIQQAVIAAETKTSGEIVPMIVSASGRYAEIELSGLVVGLVCGTLAALLWHDPWGSVQIYLFWPVVGAILGFAICSIPSLKRRMISKDRIADAVQAHSLAAFTAHGLHYTKAHTGILIFASLLEHRVVVLADRGINEKVAAGTWDEIVNTITEGLKSGNGCDGFCKAIERCGEILAQHFPRSADDRDELPNKLVTEE
jgi:putative membrane protein